MPPPRAVPPLEELAAETIVARLWRLGSDGERPEPALALCSHLQHQLPPPLQTQLAEQLERRGRRQQAAAPLHAAAAYLLGGRRARLRLDDLAAVCQLAEGAAPPAGGPRALSVYAVWEDSRSERHTPALARLLVSFTQLVSLQLTQHCTNGQLAAVGRCCPRLVKLHVELAMADDEGVRLLLGLPDDMEQSLVLCRRGVPLQPSNMATLRDVSFESTMVGVRGNILLLQALPKLQACRVSEVDLGDVMDGIFGVEPTTRRAMWPCYELRRLECRYPLQTHQAEALARCCRRLQHLCLRGHCSARNDLMMLSWFTSLTQLCSLELIDVHPAALAEFLPLVADRLSSLHLLETSRSSVGPFSAPAAHLWPLLPLCPGLRSLQLSPAAEPRRT